LILREKGGIWEEKGLFDGSSGKLKLNKEAALWEENTVDYAFF